MSGASLSAPSSTLNPFAGADPDAIAALVLKMLPSVDSPGARAAVAAGADEELRASVRGLVEAAFESLAEFGFVEGCFGGYETLDSSQPVQLIGYGRMRDPDIDETLLVVANLELLNEDAALGTMKLEVAATYMPKGAPEHPSDPWPEGLNEPVPLCDPYVLVEVLSPLCEDASAQDVEPLTALLKQRALALFEMANASGRAQRLAAFRARLVDAIAR